MKRYAVMFAILSVIFLFGCLGSQQRPAAQPTDNISFECPDLTIRLEGVNHYIYGVAIFRNAGDTPGSACGLITVVTPDNYNRSEFYCEEVPPNGSKTVGVHWNIMSFSNYSIDCERTNIEIISH